MIIRSADDRRRRLLDLNTPAGRAAQALNEFAEAYGAAIDAELERLRQARAARRRAEPAG